MARRWWPYGLFFAALLGAAPAAAEGAPGLAEARARQAIGEYDDAATLYEGFAKMYPRKEEAKQALEDAVVLRLGLGQIEQATKDAELFMKLYGRVDPTLSSRISLALARHHLQHEDFAAAKKRLTAWIAAFDAKAPPDMRAVAHAALGRSAAKLGDAKQADASYRAVLDLWKDPAAAISASQRAGADDRRLGAALTAVGEAHFHVAEQRRKEVEAIAFPVYRGSGSKDDVFKHVRTKVVDWMKAKRAAVEQVEKDYLKVAQIEPFPPPRWVIAASARVGQIWGRFAAELRAAPVPKEWRGRGTGPGGVSYDEIRRAYYAGLDDAAEPLKQRAKAAFKTCVNTSAKFQFADEHSESCARWLTRHYRAEHPAFDELAPRWGALGPATPPSDPLPDPR